MKRYEEETEKKEQRKHSVLKADGETGYCQMDPPTHVNAQSA